MNQVKCDRRAEDHVRGVGFGLFKLPLSEDLEVRFSTGLLSLSGADLLIAGWRGCLGSILPMILLHPCCVDRYRVGQFPEFPL